MNIQAAIGYVKIYYRVRRASWKPGEYLKNFAHDIRKVSEHTFHTFDISTKKIVSHTSLKEEWSEWQPSIDDLLANDWEVITTGIRKYFNKWNHLEYDDDVDWDNYEPDENDW